MGLIDRGLSALLLLGAIAHALASLRSYGADGERLIPALAASAFLALLAAVHWLRAARPGDRPLARIAFAFGALLCLLVAAWSIALESFFDGRVVAALLVALGLVWFSARALARR